MLIYLIFIAYLLSGTITIRFIMQKRKQRDVIMQRPWGKRKCGQYDRLKKTLEGKDCVGTHW